MFITESDKRMMARHSLAMIRDTISDLLDKAVKDETDFKLHGGVTWKLTARRMLFDYSRIDRASDGYRRVIEKGLSKGYFSHTEVIDVVLMLVEFARVVNALVKGARSALKDGQALTALADDDSEAPEFIGEMISQEQHGDEMVIERLKDVIADPLSVLYSRMEFAELQGFYEDQPRVIAELGAAHKHFRDRMPMASRTTQQSQLAKLKRNHSRILRMLDKVFLMYE